MRHPIKAFLLAVAVVLARADGPADNVADKVRRIPPPGIAIPEDARRELTEGAAQLAGEIDALRGALTNRPALLARLPDVQVSTRPWIGRCVTTSSSAPTR
jgi:hypothetical protein